MDLRLLAVRHGATAWSGERRFAGSQDIPLTVEGRRQCEAVARALAPLPIAALYASPLARARESAAAIAEARRLDVIVEPDFREMGFGDWEGLTRDEVARRFSGEWAVWRSTPERFACPGSETLGGVADRVARGLAGLCATHRGETVVLVSHAIVIRLLVLAALGFGPERLWSVDIAPAGISEIAYHGDAATVHRVNSLAHLEDDGGPRQASQPLGAPRETQGAPRIPA